MIPTLIAIVSIALACVAVFLVIWCNTVPPAVIHEPRAYTTVTYVGSSESSSVCELCGKTDFKANLIELTRARFQEEVKGALPSYCWDAEPPVWIHAKCGNYSKCECGFSWVYRTEKVAE